MSKIQPDDAFIIHREGKDYKATVDQFAKDINIHVECGGGGGESTDTYLPWEHEVPSDNQHGLIHVMNVEAVTVFSEAWERNKVKAIISRLTEKFEQAQTDLRESDDAEIRAKFRARMREALKNRKRIAANKFKAANAPRAWTYQTWRRKEDLSEGYAWEYLGWTTPQGTLEPGYEFVFSLFAEDAVQSMFMGITTDFCLGPYTDTSAQTTFTSMFAEGCKYTGLRQQSSGTEDSVGGGQAYLDFSNAILLDDFFYESAYAGKVSFYFPKGEDFTSFFRGTPKKTFDYEEVFRAPICSKIDRLFQDCLKLTDVDFERFSAGDNCNNGISVKYLFQGCRALETVKEFQQIAENGFSFSSCFQDCTSLFFVRSGSSGSKPINFAKVGKISSGVSSMVRNCSLSETELSRWYFPNYTPSYDDPSNPDANIVHYGVDGYSWLYQNRDITNATTAHKGTFLSANGDETFTFKEIPISAGNQPQEPIDGHIWVDITKCPPVINIWNGCDTGNWYPLNPSGQYPWDGHNGGIWHVKNATKLITLHDGPYQACTLAGDMLPPAKEFGPGDEFLFFTTSDASGLFSENLSGNWEFGDRTDTSKVKNMSYMFGNAKEFNFSINNWDTSNVTNMSGMFDNARTFNQSLSNWNTSKVTNMAELFYYASSFNNSLSGWDTSSVTDMDGMFARANVFNHSSIRGLNTSNVVSTYMTFSNTSAFNQDISSWDVSNVTNMSYMFYGAKGFNAPLDAWGTKVSNVTNMEYLFYNAVIFNQPLNTWDVSNVTNFGGTFDKARKFNQNINDWDVSNGIMFSSMFNEANMFNINLTLWDTSNATSMSSMFRCTQYFNGDISNFATGKVTKMTQMFNNAQRFNKDISNWDMSSVKDISTMFRNCKVFNAPIGKWNVSNMKHINNAFTSCFQFNQDLSQWDTSNCEYMQSAFIECTNLTSDFNTWDVSKVVDMAYMFYQNFKFNSELDNWDTSNCEDFGGMFEDSRVFNSDISMWDVSKSVSFKAMFHNCFEFNQPISKWEVNYPGWIYYMFANCHKFNQDLSSWKIKDVEEMYYVFAGCDVFNGDISTWDVSTSDDLQYLFAGAKAFNQDITGWRPNPDNYDMTRMFENATAFNQDLSVWGNFNNAGDSDGVKPRSFDTGSGFEGQDDRQPTWHY